MEPPSKDDPANPFGYKKVCGKQPQSAFRPAPPALRPQVDPDAPISTRLPDGG